MTQTETDAARPVVAVIGAGVMGAGIAQVLSAECEVRLHDVSRDQLLDAMTRIEHGRFGLLAAAERGLSTREAAEAALGRLKPTDDLRQACADADFVVEAVPEDLALKMAVFAQLDARCPEQTVLTSNSGGLPIVALAHATRRPERVLGWHWAQPAPVMRLAELVLHPTVAEDAVARVADLARRCGKNPVAVRDQPHVWGYVANRLQAVVRQEARRIVDEEVATPEQVDQLVKDCFRWPMGPFEMQSTTTLG